MRWFKYLTLYFLTILLTFPGFTGEVTKVGATAAPFLTIGVGARSLGMGGAFVAVANDASAMFWNVSGIAQVNQPMIIFNHSEWLADINFDYAGIIAPISGFGTIGLNITALTMEDFEQTTELQPEGTGVRFSVGSFALGLSFARRLTDNFMFGVTAKLVNEHIWNSSANGFAIDVGTLFTTPFNGLRIGMSISNFGSKLHMSGDDLLVQIDIDPTISGNNETINAFLETDNFDMPLLFRVGLSYDLLKSNERNSFTLSVDALHPNDNAESINVGGEYVVQDLVFLRGGYRSIFLPDSEEGFTVGGGIKLNFSESTGLNLDYAYEDFGRLDNIQKFTLQLKF